MMSKLWQRGGKGGNVFLDEENDPAEVSEKGGEHGWNLSAGEVPGGQEDFEKMQVPGGPF